MHYSDEEKYFPESLKDLEMLLNYLVDEHGQLQPLKEAVTLKWAREHDRVNETDPRAFCYVEKGSPIIHCALALEAVNPEVRLGILLHEIGHIRLQEFTEEGEVTVDEWCSSLEEIGYHYRSGDYWHPVSGEFVTARNVEHVSLDFVNRLYAAYS